MDSFFTPYCPPAHARLVPSGPTPEQLAQHAMAVQAVQNTQFHTHHVHHAQTVNLVQMKVLRRTPYGIVEETVFVPVNVNRLYYV